MTAQRPDGKKQSGAARVLAVFHFIATVPEGATLKEITAAIGAISVTALARRMPGAMLEQAVPTIRSIIKTELGGVLA